MTPQPWGTSRMNAIAPGAVRPRDSHLVTVVLIALLFWLPLQTPIAVFAFQYGGLPVWAVQALLAAKDATVASLLVFLLARNWSRIAIRWFDWLAAGFVLAVAVYAVVPIVVGTSLSAFTIVASVREYLVPVELYALGRLAAAAGADLRAILRWFLAVSAVAALISLVTYLLPVQLWESTLDLVTFERVVQGIPSATSLWAISVVGQYGVGDTAVFPRAVWPFTHPVGTSHYFVLPLAMTVAMSFMTSSSGRGVSKMVLAAIVLFTLALIVPISRGNWLAALAAVGILGLLYRRTLVSVVGAATVVIALSLIPPFSYSIASALDLSDTSAAAHKEVVEEGIETVGNNPLGIGMGQADQLFGRGGDEPGESSGVGENLYLSLWVNTGPLGLAAFLGWVAGLWVALVSVRQGPDGWAAAAVAGALVGYLAAALTSSALMRFTTSASFWLFTGLLAASAASADLRGAFQRIGHRLLRGWKTAQT
jgi:hypothetical protein